MKIKALTLLIALSIFITILFYYNPISTSKNEEVEIIEETFVISISTSGGIPVEYEFYSRAKTVWLMMKSFGWNDITCAGILGNLMVECGQGNKEEKIHLDYWDLYRTNGPIGICQWLGGRKTCLLKIYGDTPTLEDQVWFMYYELTGKKEGIPRQVSEYEYNKIMTAKTPTKAAYYFAKYFERPNNPNNRGGCAKYAYEIFKATTE